MNNATVKGKLGAGYVDDRYTLPKDGETGDILVKTETGSEWQKQEPATSTPDWDQNSSSANDYIKNRPGGYTISHPAKTITWDGVVGERVTCEIGGVGLTKISDDVFTVEELTGGTVEVANGEQIITIALTESTVISQNEMVCVAKGDAVLLSTDSTQSVPEAGTYSIDTIQNGNHMYVSSLKTIAKEEIVKIPVKYMPDIVIPTIIKESKIKLADGCKELIDELNSNYANGIPCMAYLKVDMGRAFVYMPLTKVAANNFYFSENSDSDSIVIVPDTAGWNLVTMINRENIVIPSSTSGSTKKFKITVDDSGTISATEVT